MSERQTFPLHCAHDRSVIERCPECERDVAAGRSNGFTRPEQVPSKERDAFELWAEGNHWNTRRNPYNRDMYQSDYTQYGWWAWKAARASNEPSVWRSDPVIPAYEWVWVGSAYSSGYSGPFYHETTKKLSDYANADCWCLVAQPARPAATKSSAPDWRNQLGQYEASPTGDDDK